MVPVTRQLRLDDVPVLADLLRRNRDFLAPLEPEWEEAWFIPAGQRDAVDEALARQQAV
jgi:ribosomal-protein-alanine N-acetyltransferase